MFTHGKKKKFVHKKKRQQSRLSNIQKQFVFGFLLFISITLLLVGVWFGTRIESLQINNIEIVGGFTIAQSEIKKVADSTLSGAYFRLVPKRFKILYPRKEIERNILSIDRVKNVHAEIVSPQTLVIVYEEYKPYALWCSSEDKQKCIFIDASGYAFAQAPKLTGNAFVRYVTNEDITVGNQSFPPSFIDETKEFIEMLETSLSLYVIQVQKLGDYDIEYLISGGGVLKVSQAISAQESFDNLEAVLNSEEFKHIEPGAFQYIDLRFGDKVFINEEVQSAEVSTSSTPSLNPL